MSVNKIKIQLPENDKFVNIPIQMNWDFTGRDNAIEAYEGEVAKEIVGVANDFEVSRFAHDKHSNNLNTYIDYQFYFYSGVQSSVTASTSSNWINSYLYTNGFSTLEVYEYANSFRKSFFKLDFYDTSDESTQNNYLTVIIPTQQGYKVNVNYSSYLSSIDIKTPNFRLDYVGDKEGFFIYWLRNTDFLDIKTFYMTAKFFDAKNGQFIKFMNRPQSSTLGSVFGFRPEDYFYYRVDMDYPTRTYKVFDYNGNRIGTTNSIKWYQYVNPSL
jgi:hypothetical protein